MQPQLVADTGKRYTTIRETAEIENLDSVRGGDQSNVFKSAQWTADGTTILTSNENNVVRTFVLPVDLLSESTVPHDLTPYLSTPFPEPVYAVTTYPNFTLSDLSTTCYLASIRDQPIKLQDALSPTPHLRASYHFTQPETERVITPHSLIFSHEGSRFIAGSENLIAIFDLSRPGPGSDPISWLQTIPSKKARKIAGGTGLKGIVSTLDISSEGVLAAGTFSKGVGLYDSQGGGDCIAVFSLESTRSGEIGHGQGITQVKWSADGRYLYIAERKSDAIHVYDIRVTGRRLAILQGRKADTNQRLGFDLLSSSKGQGEVWAGGTDGKVRVWKADGTDVEPFAEFEAHGDPVTSTIVHPSGSLIATSSGQRKFTEYLDEAEGQTEVRSETDNSLKVWYLT